MSNQRRVGTDVMRLQLYRDDGSETDDELLAVGCLFPSGTTVWEWKHRDEPTEPTRTQQAGLTVYHGDNGVRETLESFDESDSREMYIEYADEDLRLDSTEW